MKTTVFRFSVLLTLLFCATVVRAQSQQQCAIPSYVHQTPDQVKYGYVGSHQYIASQTVTYIVTCINNLQPGTTYGTPQTNPVTATGDYSTVFGACNPTFGTAVQYDSNSWTASKFENLGYPSHDTSDPFTGHDLGCKPGVTQETDTLCQPQACPTSTCQQPPPPYCGQNASPSYDPTTCTWTCVPSGNSPVLIDVSGQGFQLTNASNGVSYDIAGNGSPIQMGWTAPGAQNAFLCLPDANGNCDSGKQLFGNFTPQPASSTPNGFAALAVYDGNHDGVIDAHDAIFSSLRLWIDANHDGISQPNELFSLPALGITSISLNYKWDQRTDQYGNVFRYRAQVERTDGAGRMAYDVFFVTQSSGTAKNILKACPPRPALIEEKTGLR